MAESAWRGIAQGLMPAAVLFLVFSMVSSPAAAGERAKTAAPAAYSDVIFLHHSTGANLITQGRVRPLLTGMGFRFWDHGYNADGLTMPDGTPAGYDYGIPGDNTNPDGFATIFSQPLVPTPPHPQPPANAFSGLLRHQVIAFKSCFPASAIGDDGMLAQYKGWYRTVRDRARQYPDRVFIAFSTPPLTPAATSRAEARRARAFATWLKSQAYLSGAPNLFAFDFFSLLAEPNAGSAEYSMLRARYRPGGDDSHPNAAANRAIGPVFARFVKNAVGTYSAGCSAPPSMPALTAPPNGARTATRQVLLDWSDRACTAHYEVQVRLGSAAGPAAVGEIATASLLRTPPLAGGRMFYWRVSACNNRGCSPWTAYRRFKVP